MNLINGHHSPQVKIFPFQNPADEQYGTLLRATFPEKLRGAPLVMAFLQKKKTKRKKSAVPTFWTNYLKALMVWRVIFKSLTSIIYYGILAIQVASKSELRGFSSFFFNHCTRKDD